MSAILDRLRNAAQEMPSDPIWGAVCLLTYDDVLDVLELACPEHLACESCGSTICDACRINERSTCIDRTLCQDCHAGRTCLPCRDEGKR